MPQRTKKTIIVPRKNTFLKCDNNFKSAWTGAPAVNKCTLARRVLPIKNVCHKKNVFKKRMDAINDEGYFNSIDRGKFLRCGGEGMCGLTVVASDNPKRNQGLVDKAYKYTCSEGSIDAELLHCLLEGHDKDFKNCVSIEFDGAAQFNRLVSEIPIGSEIYVSEFYKKPNNDKDAHVFRVLSGKRDDGKPVILYSTNTDNSDGKEEYEEYNFKQFFKDKANYKFRVGFKLKDEDYKCSDDYYVREGNKTVPLQRDDMVPNPLYKAEDLTHHPGLDTPSQRRVPSKDLIEKRWYRRELEKHQQIEFDNAVKRMKERKNRSRV